MYDELKNITRRRREDNRRRGAAILKSHNVSYTEHNEGAHLILRHGGRRVDYYPGTGRWVSGPDSGRGIFGLLRYLDIPKLAFVLCRNNVPYRCYIGDITHAEEHRNPDTDIILTCPIEEIQ